ncbi:MAG TPA: sporulation protein YqfD [Candidatus Faecousia intestinigallinarum]|nr:sporulation protein YqfD [Candidatus Faecousia intestinigallinarum]
MNILYAFAGAMVAEVTSADIPRLLQVLNNAGIPLGKTRQTGDLTVELTVSRRDYPRLEALCRKRGEKLRLQRRIGLYWQGKALLHRPVLLSGLALLLALACFIPTRVLFVKVEGNVQVPEKWILEQAERCGIGFWASRREVRSEKMKNALLEAIPQLQWAGVNTQGCVATISVRERSAAEQAEKPNGVGSVVASRDGIIQEITVLRGNGLCKVGQAVKAGEVLISGYTDCGISIQATRAEGEVFAQTHRTLQAVTPDSYALREESTCQHMRISLRIGKKRIFFTNNSGFIDGSCDKMYTEYICTLPGGFQLPLALIVERWECAAVLETPAEETEMAQTLQAFSQAYLAEQMVAGEILQQTEVVEGGRLYGEYACREMIGRVQSEEIIQSNGEND